MASTLPPVLPELVRRWRVDGQPRQVGSSWSRRTWISEFPEHVGLLERLPDRIDRPEVTQHAADALLPDGALRAFLVAMVWGHGPVGYGAWRTKRVLRENPSAAERLAEIAEVARNDGGVAAFRKMAEQPLRYLGVAFGTKYLRFVTAAHPSPSGVAPILDSVMRRWLMAHAGVRLDIDRWRSSTYERYVELLSGWAEELDLTADRLEELIYRARAGANGASATEQDALRRLEAGFELAEPDVAAEARPHLDALALLLERISPPGVAPR